MEVPEPAPTGTPTPEAQADEEPTTSATVAQTSDSAGEAVERPLTPTNVEGDAGIATQPTEEPAPQIVDEPVAETVEHPQPDAVIPELDLDQLITDLPYWEADEIDPGHPSVVEYFCWNPENVPRERDFPFHDLALEDITVLRDAIPGANVSKIASKQSQEFLRNYVRGQTLKQLRKQSMHKNMAPGALQKFLDLPLELLFDILELVHPMDLLHLSRSTKQMQTVLTTPRAKEVWAASYNNHADTVPSFNSTIPPLQWTAMLYAPAICDFCGRKGALMDLAFKERYCENCQESQLKDRSDLRPRLKDYTREAEDIFDLLLHTYRQCGDRYQTSYESTENARYRVKDFESTLEELQEWYMTIDEGALPDAGDKFQEWKQARRQAADNRNYTATQANNWAMNISYTLGGELYERQQRAAKAFVQRLIRLGHDTRDVESADSDIFYILRSHNLAKLNSRVFDSLKEEVITRIDGHKRNRLRKERREKTTQVYSDYKKTLKPVKWQTMPPLEVMLYQEPFNTFLNGPVEETMELTLDEAKEKLPQAIEEWTMERRLEQYQMIPGHQMPEVEQETEEGLSDEELAIRAHARELSQKENLNNLMEQRMNLATSVFSCSSCKSGRHSAMALIGWDATFIHLCGSQASWYHTGFEFCSVGYAAAANIIRSVGLNPETATPAELDAIDARFFCLNCPVTLHRKIRGRKAYTWRECVQHAVEKEEDHGHAIPSWTRLAEEITTFVNAHEPPPPVFRRANWGCNHCSEHFDTPVLRKEAIAHVKTAHSIENPVDGTDFIDFKHRFEKGGNYRQRHIFHFGVEPTCNLVCKLCQSGKRKKMWTTLNLIPHLFHKHGISMPSSSRDYYKIPVFHGD